MLTIEGTSRRVGSEMKLNQQRKGCVCGKDTTQRHERNGLTSTGQTEANKDGFSHGVVTWKQTAQ